VNLSSNPAGDRTFFFVFILFFETKQMDNITYRRPGRTNSLNDLTNMSESNERILFDTTMMSMPDSLHDNSNAISDLNEQVKLLTTQLQSAHQEIEHLISENFQLKCDLNDMAKKNETFKKICSTPVRKGTTPKSMSKNKQHPNKDIMTLNNQYHEIKKDKEAQVNLCCTHTSNYLNPEPPSFRHSSVNTQTAKNGSKTKFNRPKNKLCVFSCNRFKGALPIIEDTFSSYFEYCHFSFPNSTITGAMSNMENKLKNFTLSDYCIFVIGENDIKSEDNYVNTIEKIKERLQKVTHTNKIICVPTYIAGAPIYNYKVELFNNLLHLDIKNNNYALLFDSNYYLTLEMFSQISGKINKQGFKHLYKGILNNILIAMNAPDSTDHKTHNDTSTTQVESFTHKEESSIQLFL
jgi:regulator of replication initiation timing